MIYSGLKLQERTGTCGLACLRNSLLLSYGIVLSERRLKRISQEFYYAYRKKDRISRDGIGPWGLSKLVKEEVSDAAEIDFKFFMTNHGNINQLRELLADGIYPIIHRSFHEVDGNDKDGHYELVVAVNNGTVILHNPAWNVKTSGIYAKNKREFYCKWWDFEGNRWFAAIYPASEKLDRKKFARRNA